MAAVAIWKVVQPSFKNSHLSHQGPIIYWGWQQVSAGDFRSSDGSTNVTEYRQVSGDISRCQVALAVVGGHWQVSTASESRRQVAAT